MVDRILLFNGSKKLDDGFVVDALEETRKLRGIEVVDVEEAVKLVQKHVERNYNEQRKQLNSATFLAGIHGEAIMGDWRNFFREHWRDGKILLVDEDLYIPGFGEGYVGEFISSKFGLGYIIISTATLQDDVVARDAFRHEAGHMFNAPGGRNREVGGCHCLNDLCVMQADGPREYCAHERVRTNVPAYCADCANDIRNHVVKEWRE